MLVSISSYSLGPFIGLIINTILTGLSLLTFIFFPGYRVLKSLTLFCLSISLYFAGHAFYGLQSSDESILFWYRIMLIGLAWMPVTWIYFSNCLRNRPSGGVAQAALGLALALTLALIIIEDPLVLGGPLQELARAGVRRPQSLVVKPLILIFDLSVALPSMGLIWFSWWPGPVRPAFVKPFLFGLIFWGLGGLHDAAYNLNLGLAVLDQPILWLASIWLSLCLTITVALHFRTLDRAVQERWQQLSAANVSVIRDIPTDLVIQGDWSLLVMAFGCLLDNSLAALAAKDRGGRVVVSVAEDGPSNLKIVFEDDGPGMSPEQVEAAFQPFNTSRPAEMGLGLPLVQSIIGAHQGKVRLLSFKHKGVRVILDLPLGLVEKPGPLWRAMEAVR